MTHHPAVPWRDLPALAQHLFSDDQPSAGKSMLELLILTATRSGEVRGMRWDEIDFKCATWTIPASRMKAKQFHRVPLPSRAIEILDRRRKMASESPLVFPSRRKMPLSDMTLTKPLRDAEVSSDAPGRVATAVDAPQS